jgi:hypothetical protein
MGRRSVVHVAISLLLLPVITTHNNNSINLQTDSSQSMDVFDGSGEGSGQMINSAELTDIQTETNFIEEWLSDSTNESSVQQKQFLNNETFSSVERLGTVLSVSSLQLSSEDNNETKPNPASSATNSTDPITKGENNSESLQQASNQTFSPLVEFDDPFNTSKNHIEYDSNTSHIAASHMDPQQYTSSVNADCVSVIKWDTDNISSPSIKDNVTEDSFEQPLDEHSFKQRLNVVPTRHQNQTAEEQSNASVTEIKFVNFKNYNRSEAMHATVEHSQEQSDSPAAHNLNNLFDSEETFEKVFNMSVNDTVDSEHKHHFSHQEDSEEQAERSVSNAQVSGSDTENRTTDNNLNFNDFSALNNAFEIYHYSHSDADGDNRTLAQHIEELVLNRLPSLDKHKANTPDSKHQGGDQIGSEDHEEDDISLGVEISPEEISESDNEETHSGATLAFVFDSTGSMWDDLVQVKMGAERIMATMLERPDKPIYNYVLVPFHDPSKLLYPYPLEQFTLRCT